MVTDFRTETAGQIQNNSSMNWTEKLQKQSLKLNFLFKRKLFEKINFFFFFTSKQNVRPVKTLPCNVFGLKYWNFNSILFFVFLSFIVAVKVPNINNFSALTWHFSWWIQWIYFLKERSQARVRLPAVCPSYSSCRSYWPEEGKQSNSFPENRPCNKDTTQ